MAATENALTDPFALNGDEYFWMKGNLHSHTTNSDGRVSPQERLDGYVARGTTSCACPTTTTSPASTASTHRRISS